MIQVEQLLNWLIKNANKIANDTRNMEIYNATITPKLKVTKQKWNSLLDATNINITN
jgi:hypothetical protein